MKKTIIKVALAATVALGATWPAQAAEKTAGIIGGISTDPTAPVTGIFFGLQPISHLRVVPSFTYQFKQGNTDAFRFNIDVQSPWAIAGTRFRVYPLAGVSVSRFNTVKSDNSPQRIDRLGFNVGGGLEWKPSAMLGLKLFAEGKYSYAKNFDSALVTLGIGYAF